MKSREVILKLARYFEGRHLKSYRCPAGVWTIGYGATGKDIGPDLAWTEQQAEERLNKDASLYLSAAKNLCPCLEGEAHGAIGDFAFNLGATRLAGSTLRRRINAGDWDNARDEIQRWVWAGGRKLPGLILRRMAEAGYLKDEAGNG